MDGTKIQHEYSDGQQDRYIGSLVYYNTGEFSVPFGGGRLVSAGNTTAAHYFLTDHLGSTRVVAKVTPTGHEDLDRKDYYPFGQAWTQSGMPTSGNAFLFSGKERQDIKSDDCVTTPLYDFGARFYDPDSGMWLQQDPLMQFHSPYTYCGNNPIRWRDPFGLWTEIEGGGGYTTNDPNEISDFLTANKNSFMGKSAYNYVNNLYTLDNYMESNYGVYTRKNGEYSTAIPLALVIAKNTSGQWQAQNMDEIRNWQSEFARNFEHHLTMSNPIVKSIHIAQREFLSAIPDIAAFAAVKGGDYITALGIATAPFGVGAPLMALGGTMSVLGNSYYGIQNIIEGNTATGMYQAGTSLFFYFLPFSLNKYMTEGQQAIFNGFLLPHSITISKTME